MKADAKSSLPRFSKLHPLELRTYLKFKNVLALGQKKIPRKVLIACSGGLDSVVLGSVVVKIAPRLGWKLGLAHVHHGRGLSSSLSRSRDRALNHVRHLSGDWGVDFYHRRPPDDWRVLKTEEEFRDFRLAKLAEIRADAGFDWVCFAHHADDLFETRLIRLIRGTGPQGLKSMSPFKGHVMRPFLSESRKELRDYAHFKGLSWVTDPSNSSTEPLRNWVRLQWLPQLEEKRPGGGEAFRRSLELISRSCEGPLAEVKNHHGLRATTSGWVIDRGVWQQLDDTERRLLLAHFLRLHGTRNFRANHIDEVLKRLRSARRELRFEVLRQEWVVNAQQIGLRPRVDALPSTQDEAQNPSSR